MLAKQNQYLTNDEEDSVCPRVCLPGVESWVANSIDIFYMIINEKLTQLTVTHRAKFVAWAMTAWRAKGQQKIFYDMFYEFIT